LDILTTTEESIKIWSNSERGMNMNKKWILKISGSLLAAMLIAGCADDQDPAPPEDNMEEETPEETPPVEDETEQDMEEDMEEDMQEDENNMEEEMDMEDEENNQ
jgi:PBP1b-binding outer membrane lipoprotein LpoB